MWMSRGNKGKASVFAVGGYSCPAEERFSYFFRLVGYVRKRGRCRKVCWWSGRVRYPVNNRVGTAEIVSSPGLFGGIEPAV